MVRGHERRELARGRGHAHVRERLGGHARPDHDVTPLPDLPDVVQQQRAQPHAVGILDPLHGVPLDRIVGVDIDGGVGFRIGGQHAIHLAQGTGQVPVDGVQVVWIALGPAPHVGPGGKVAGQQIQTVERLEGIDASVT